MTVRSENKIVPITLPKFHQGKLSTACKRLGLTKSALIQRLIEDYKMFGEVDKKP